MRSFNRVFIKKWHSGDVVMVRPFDEIRQTLDENGQLNDMPFMPEMLQYCGKQFQISRRANYVCVDGNGMRGLDGTFILKDIYCDGSAHDGCQKSCTVFWKESWLKKPSDSEWMDGERGGMIDTSCLKTRNEITNRYLCQSTRLAASTCFLTPLTKSKFFLKELISHNQRIAHFIIHLLYFIHFKLSRTSVNSVCQFLKGKAEHPPRETLALQAGDWIEIKSKEEIADTLDLLGKNHGLIFTSEMHRFCGKQYRVKQRLDKMISETSGMMVKLRDTVLLENVHCYGICKFGCSRQLLHYWREIWLRRV